MTEAAADRTAAFEGRQVEQGSKVFHAGCLKVQGCVAHAVQEECARVCGWGELKEGERVLFTEACSIYSVKTKPKILEFLV